jgi:multidrug efflux system outer membrane protein
MKHNLWLITLASLLLSGCSTLSMPWQDEEPSAASSESVVSQSAWWSDFKDPLIDEFVGKLQTQNIDIQIAEARLAEARALKTVSRSGFFPDLSATANGTRGNTASPKPEAIGQAGFDISWELDVFGRTRAGVDATEARRLASLAGIDDAKNIVTAELVRAVIEWRQAKQTTKEINDLLKAQDDQVSLLESRTKAGLIDASFLERAQAQRAQTASGLPDAEAAANAAKYQIERLLAVRDQSVQTAFANADIKIMNIPRVEDALSITLERVRHRPDVRQARANLLASQADLKQAEADLWPRVTLSSFFGVQDGSDGLRLADNPIWSLASAVTMPLLNFGRLRGMVDAADARVQQASLRYEDTINRALQETKTALSDYLNGINAASAQESALKSRRDTVRIAKERFDRGLTDMTDLTTAQAELDNATISLINIKTETAIAYIRLQKALATGFYPDETE